MRGAVRTGATLAAAMRVTTSVVAGRARDGKTLPSLRVSVTGSGSGAAAITFAIRGRVFG